MVERTGIALPAANRARNDYIALRVYRLKLPLHRIADLYCSEESP